MTNAKNTVTFGATSEAIVEDQGDAGLCWYSKKELHTIRKEGQQLFNEAKSVGICLRGLEPLQEGADHLQKRRRHFIQGFLAVQMELRDMNMYDPKGLQCFASAHSLQDAKAALRRGKQDASDVNQSKGGTSVLHKKPAFTKASSARNFQPRRVSDMAKCA